MPERHLLPADLFPRYTRLRREGLSADEALDSLAPQARALSLAQQQELARMIGAWEVSPLTHGEPPEGVPAPGEELPLAPDQVACPNCGRPNRRGQHYCFACGHILPGAPDTQTLQGRYDFMDSRTRWGTAYFDQEWQLVLVPQYGDPIEVETPEGQDILIGHLSSDPVAAPHIDLAPYDAEMLGVSRLHLAVRRQGNTVTVTDLGSVNHSYINGQRLYPHELRVLRDGDELRLGRMALRVRFKIED